MKFFLAATAIAACSVVACADDFDTECHALMGTLKGALTKAEGLQVEGKSDEATAGVLAAFPEPRSAAQSFMLGNVLYRQEPALSYALHKKAFELQPNNDAVVWEWAMEQHRAKEWAGAQASYEKSLKSRASFAPVYGLLAECLIRQDKVQEAADAWKKSEDSPDGTLEDFETLVFETHGAAPKNKDRSALLTKVRAKDAVAAEDLISLDAAWPTDWWNNGPQHKSLAFDLKTIKEAGIPKSPQLDAALCAAELALLEDDGDEDAPKAGKGKEKSSAILKRYGFIVDTAGTLPDHGGLLSIMLTHAMSDGLTKQQARTRFADRVYAMAKKGKDAEMYNAAANLAGEKSPKLAEIDQAGWDATGDARFAASRVAQLAGKGNLKLSDPILTKALAAFPEDGIIAAIAFDAAKNEGKPLRPYLVAGIKAEYSHFSPQGFVLRAGANQMRSYFNALRKDLASGAKNATPAPASKP